MKRMLLSIVASSGALLSFAQNAAPATVQDSVPVRLMELESITVVATRARKEMPVASHTIGRERIEKVDFGTDLPFLLTLSPSLVATSDAGNGVGYTAIRIRGTDPSRINVTLNGVPVNDAESHGVYWVNMPDVASSVDDIQVQRGVGTSTSGAGAFGGSVSLKTSAMRPAPAAEVSSLYGSFNTYRYGIKFSTGLMESNWAVDARLSRQHSDGYIERGRSDLGSYFLQVGRYANRSMLRIVALSGSEQTYHAWNGISAGMLKSNRRYNPSGEILDADGKVTGFYKNQTDNYAQGHYQLIYNYLPGSRWSLNITGHYTRGEGYYEEFKNGRRLVEYALEPYTVDGELVTKADLVRRKMMENDFGGVMATAGYRYRSLDLSFGAAANLYAGSHFGRVIKVQNYLGALDPDHEYYLNRSNKQEQSAFARMNLSFGRTGRGNFFVDLQYRHIRHRIEGNDDKWNGAAGELQRMDVDRQYGFFNPRAGLSYNFAPAHQIYGYIGIAHKEPARNDFTDAMEGHIPLPERLTDIEGGYRYEGRAVGASVNFYDMSYHNQLILTGRTNEIGEPLAENVPASFRRGIELLAGVQIAEWLRWDITSTLSLNKIRDYREFTDTYDESWNPQAQSEQLIGKTTISYSPSLLASSLVTADIKGLSVTLQSSYVGEQYITNSMRNELKLDAYSVTNLYAARSFRMRGIGELTAGAAINNLFDSKYVSNAWGYSYIVGGDRFEDAGYFPQATINFAVNLCLKF